MFIRVLHLIGFFLPFSTGFTSHHIRPSFAKLKTFSKGAVKELITEPAQEECLLTAAPVSVVKLTWEPETADDIRDVINDRIQRRGENERHQPYMVAVVGIPGSGKVRSKSQKLVIAI